MILKLGMLAEIISIYPTVVFCKDWYQVFSLLLTCALQNRLLQTNLLHIAALWSAKTVCPVIVENLDYVISISGILCFRMWSTTISIKWQTEVYLSYMFNPFIVAVLAVVVIFQFSDWQSLGGSTECIHSCTHLALCICPCLTDFFLILQ